MLVSVYIPTRNRAAQLRKAIQSVQAQTLSDWELIIVDDASDDETAAMMQGILRHDSRIKYIRCDKPEGAPSARNKAIILAQGEFVTGLDDDDTYQPDRLASFVEYWRNLNHVEMPPSGLYSQTNYVLHDRIASISKRPNRASFHDLIDNNPIGNQMFAPRRHYFESGMFDENLPAWQDLELWLRMLKLFGDAQLVNVASYNFDITPRDDRISAKAERVRRAYEMVVKKHFQHDTRSQQRLMFQMFHLDYRSRPSVRDIVKFIQLGLWPAGTCRIIIRSLAMSARYLLWGDSMSRRIFLASRRIN